MTLRAKIDLFRDLHVRGRPLILFNVWDAGSAKAVAGSGAAALATGSWSVAAAHGYSDGEHIPLALVIENARRIVSSSDLPVSIDIESGYGEDPAAVSRSVAAIAATGVVGFNMEDSSPVDGALRPLGTQVARLKAARQAADTLAVRLFLNARTDVFLQTPAENHDDALLDEAILRGLAFADAGADGLFVPGLAAPDLIERLTRASALPINIMATSATPSVRDLTALGVARISYGPTPYASAMQALSDAAREAFGAS